MQPYEYKLSEVMKIEVTQVTKTKDVLDAALWTMRKTSDIEPTSKFLKEILRAEHSPIRLLEYDIKMYDIPSWVATHFVRHHVGCEKFVSTQRDDRTDNPVPRGKAPQDTPVNLWMRCNAQSLINISRFRLCNKASDETRAIWKEVVEQIIELTPEFGSILVPNCKYRGRCTEMKSCHERN